MLYGGVARQNFREESEECATSKDNILFFSFKSKVACDVTHFARKKRLTKNCNSCWKGIRRTPTFGFILKTNKKLIKNWNELLLVCYSKTNKFNKNRFV